jgi:23S rRNA (cytosine1962-C5)-methyltransferase
MKEAKDKQTSIKQLSPTDWVDYELIDCGAFEKLERFGNYTIRRPEPQAVWKKSLSDQEWDKQADASFSRDKSHPEKGVWQKKGSMPDRWNISYQYGNMQLKFRLALTAFKHVGIFPEQAENWKFIYDQVKAKTPGAKVLNLFAYTGGASLAAKAAGADLTHVDSVKQVIQWSRENMESSGLQDIRWVVEDALKFVKREVKRGNKYCGIILDPPAYGRGPDGEKWVLEEQIDELITLCAELLEQKDSFLILNLYSMGLSVLIAETLVKQHFKQDTAAEMGELYVQDKNNHSLPLGTFYRFTT